MDYIVHYGIKGQQHGKRRFQNEDGSLTEAGKLRYGQARAAIENRKDIADTAKASANLDKEIAKAGIHETKRQAKDKVLSKKERAERAMLDRQTNRTLKDKLSSAVNGPEARAGRRHVSDAIGKIGDSKNVLGATAKLGLSELKLAYKMEKSTKKYT